MESAAISQVCHILNKPYLSIRIISDIPHHDDSVAQYENFWELAPHKNIETIQKTIQLLEKIN